MNLNPEIWGPHAWFFLDSIVLGMPNKLSENEIVVYKNFFESLQFLLPCLKCRLHYAGHLEAMPLTNEIVSSRENLMKWLFTLHNKVRQGNGQQPRSTESILKYYNKMYGTLKNTGNNKICYILIILCAIALYLLASKKYLS